MPFHISSPETTTAAAGQVKLSSRVQSTQGTRQLWFTLPEEYGEGIQDHWADSFALTLLIPAMRAGEDLRVEGSLSERLHYALNGPTQSVLRFLIPELQAIRVDADSTRANGSKPARGVATGFSGGVDSFTLLADHLGEHALPGFEVSHLLFFDVGSHGSIKPEEVCRTRYQRLLPAARELGLPFVLVMSNLDEFYDESIGFIRTYSIRNVATAMLLQDVVGRYLLASGNSYAETRIGELHAMGSAEPVLLPTLATEAFEPIPTGAEYTRVEKTARIRSFPLSHRYLDVCTAFQEAGDTRNCGRCPKCLRTCITLDLLGSLDLYAGMFDLVRYHEIRRYYMGIILGSDDKFHREIAKLIVEKDFPVPLRSRLTAWKHRLLGNRGN